ncbi:hypothetical protein GobsT_22230 [Gemmata obscuriglobus]|uniref:Carboxypeptidase regulatory-like domain-containing protein n=1 Tax=Gemmata obscuriglobus TaxID=114 RepID=A0A2Z3HDT2_9BACT|nr:hypothetical protein [Gemmata obscuriglobus]AWM39450.1 hypothetical protein C1280_22300 [Gemmata obscuriglobus]QEG27467.1 hypothetical protein GobsT_22230 [Gemmata obscuriglobus]VTS04453.1 unnamed protein product [Gemmata obscuriglobus UQM 2246]
MNLTRCAGLLLAALGAVSTPARSEAAWDNVFQVCCNDCNKPRVSYYAPPPPPCPQPEVRVNYVQRSYYQPVTEYVRKSYYEPVTKNVTSYYYEPVTEYKYSTYYDPCTGCPQRVSTPTTSYRLRSQCNAVTSYVERSSLVPVTSLRQVNYQQPVVSYYYPPTPASVSYYPLPPVIAPAGPSVEQLRENNPGVMPAKPGGSDNAIPPTDLPSTPGTSNPKSGTAKFRPEKTVSRSSVVSVRGEVVQNDLITPRANAKLVFMNANKPEQKEYTTANGFGEFDVRLPAGEWYLYVGGEAGKAAYHKKISIGDRDTVDYKVVSR